MDSLEAADFSAVNEDHPEQTILQVMLGTSTGKEQSQHLFLPGKSKQANTHTHTEWSLWFSESISKGQNLHKCHKL